jgi:hypothetical protein
MRVTVVRGGGFGGLVRVVTVDSDRLPPEDAQELEALVLGAHLLDHPGGRSQEDAQPDRFIYEVTAEDEGRVRRVRFLEQSLPPEVRALITWVASVEGRTETIQPPGALG